MIIISQIQRLLEKRKLKRINCDSSVHLAYNVHLSNPQNISIGKNTYVNGGFILAGKKSKIVIGTDCLISYNVHIRTSTHQYKCRDILIREQGIVEKDIEIGNDCWIGFGAQIMPGVKIANGCVIAAGAVVTKNTMEYGVYAGIPAKRIKERV